MHRSPVFRRNIKRAAEFLLPLVKLLQAAALALAAAARANSAALRGAGNPAGYAALTRPTAQSAIAVPAGDIVGAPVGIEAVRDGESERLFAFGLMLECDGMRAEKRSDRRQNLRPAIRMFGAGKEIADEPPQTPHHATPRFAAARRTFDGVKDGVKIVAPPQDWGAHEKPSEEIRP